MKPNLEIDAEASRSLRQNKTVADDEANKREELRTKAIHELLVETWSAIRTLRPTWGEIDIDGALDTLLRMEDILTSDVMGGLSDE